jgi:hypothetical protein
MIEFVRPMRDWKDRAAGWAVWRVTLADGSRHIVHGTRDDARDYRDAHPDKESTR